MKTILGTILALGLLTTAASAQYCSGAHRPTVAVMPAPIEVPAPAPVAPAPEPVPQK